MRNETEKTTSGLLIKHIAMRLDGDVWLQMDLDIDQPEPIRNSEGDPVSETLTKPNGRVDLFYKHQELDAGHFTLSGPAELVAGQISINADIRHNANVELMRFGPGAKLPTREELAKIIWDTSRLDEGSISATGADVIANAILQNLQMRGM
jgi:hypothetical protein